MHHWRNVLPIVSSGQAQPVRKVIILLPGGLENGGGIGRQMEYFLHAYKSSAAAIKYEIVDTRGPWYLGANPLLSSLAGFSMLASMFKLTLGRLSGGPVIAHVNIAGRGSTIRKMILVMLAQVIGLRYLLHVHEPDYGSDFGRRGKFMQSVVRRGFRRAEKVIVLGRAEKQSLIALLGLPPHQIAVLPNAVPDPQPDLGARNAEPGCHFLFLGYLSARKGVPELLQALAHPTLAAKPWRATLAGGGPVEEFRKTAESIGIASRVDFPGWLAKPAVNAVCAAADVLVLPSHGEGLAMSVLEGLSHGLAVITTPVGAHPEVIDPEISGLFVPPGDVEALAAALLRMIEDPPFRNKLQGAARARYIEKFDVTGYARRMAELHETLLSNQHAE